MTTVCRAVSRGALNRNESFSWRSTTSTFSGTLSEPLRRLRELKGFTRRGLSRHLKRHPSFISRIERGMRDVSLAEFCWTVKTLGEDPQALYAEVLTAAGIRYAPPPRRTRAHKRIRTPGE